jgi:hypothetical protein
LASSPSEWLRGKLVSSSKANPITDSFSEMLQKPNPLLY